MGFISQYDIHNIPEFKQVIVRILQLGNLKQKYIDLLTDDEGMEVYDQVFTHSSVNLERNYEFFEIMGDVTVNKCIVWYVQRRFPILAKPEFTDVISRLKIHLGSKDFLSQLGQDLNVWNFIVKSELVKTKQLKKTLEDVFEAFFGATEYIIDRRIRQCAGYDICYNIISHILDKKYISLKYEDLYDAKTRLKELFDFYKNKGIGRLEQKEDKVGTGQMDIDGNPYQLIEIKIYRVMSSDRDDNITRTIQSIQSLIQKSTNYHEKQYLQQVQQKLQSSLTNPTAELIGTGVAAKKIQAEQMASQEALKKLALKNFVKSKPEIFTRLEQQMF